MTKGGNITNAPHRWTAGCRLAIRSATALIGGYAAAAGLSSVAARLLPIERSEATAWTMIASFLVYALLSLWVFQEERLGRVTAVIWGGAAISVLLVLLLGPRS